MISKVKGVLSSTVAASERSVAVGENNYGDIHIGDVHNEGVDKEVLHEIRDGLQQLISAQVNNPPLIDAAETLTRDELDEERNQDVDDIAKLLTQHKTHSALELFTGLYERVASTASPKIRFRIKANIGICHYIMENEAKAAEYLIEAFSEAPTEPKAIANKVLALILQNKWAIAYEFGKKQLELDPNNAALAGYVIQASKYINEIKNPLAIIPRKLKTHVHILVGLVIFYQYKKNSEKWWEIAIKGNLKYPDDYELQQYSALAKLEKVFQGLTDNNGRHTSLQEEQTLRSIATMFEDKWEKAKESESGLRQEDKNTAIHLFQIYLLLMEHDRIAELVNQIIELKSEDIDFVVDTALMAFQTALLEQTERLLKDIHGNSRADFLKFRVAEVKDNYTFIAEFNEAAFSTFPPGEQIYAKLVKKIAQIKLARRKLNSTDFEELLEIAGDDPRSLLLIANNAKIVNKEDISKLAYEKAAFQINSQSHISVRFILSREAFERQDYAKVIECLDGYVSTQILSFDIRCLCTAFAYIQPVRERALRFFESLGPNVISNGHIKALNGVLFLNQSAHEKAKTCFEKSLQTDSTDLYAFSGLVNTHLKLNSENEISVLLSKINPFEMKGDAKYKMHLAQILAKYGRPKDALAFGYEVLSSNLDNPKLVQLYMGLILSSPHESIDSSLTVQPDHWIHLTNQYGEEYKFIYGDENEVCHISMIGSDHPLVRLSEGLGVGATFTQEKQFGNIDWTVTNILHKFIHLFQISIGDFENRFPNQTGLWKINIADKDLTPFLEIIKNQALNEQQKLQGYLANSIPLSFLAKLLGENVIEAAQRLVAENIQIRASTGNTDEIISAASELESNKYTEIVLDTYTAWHVATLDIFRLLKRKYEKIIVSGSVLDDLDGMIEDPTGSFGHERFSLGWQEGQYYRQESNQEEKAKDIDFIRLQKQRIVDNCIVEYVSWEIEPSEVAAQVIDMTNQFFWDAAYLARKENRILVSEDLFYRQWAKLAIATTFETSLDFILRYLHSQELISVAELSNAVLQFSSWKHAHIFLRPDILMSVFEMDESQELKRLDRLTDLIGFEDADMLSHLIVTTDYIKLLWENVKKESDRTYKAIGMVLHKLLRFYPNKSLLIVTICSDLEPELEDYVITWREREGITDEECAMAHEFILKPEHQFEGSKEIDYRRVIFNAKILADKGGKNSLVGS